MVPKGWKREPLANVAEIRTGVAVGKSDLQDPVELPYLRVANVQDGRLDLSVIKTIRVERSNVERYRLKAGDVLMTEGGDFDKLGRGDVWNGQIENCLHQNHVFCVRPNQKKIRSDFLAALSGSFYGKTYFLSCAKRSTNLASINSTQLKKFPVLLPPLPEQNKIARILSTWDKAIATTEKLIANGKMQKKALMRQLLTGKRRLPGFKREWHEIRLGDLAHITMGSSPPSEAYNEENQGLPLVQGNADIRDGISSPRSFTRITTKECKVGDILLSVRAPVGAVSMSNHRACIGRGIAALSARSPEATNFLYQLMLFFEPRWDSLSQGSTFDCVNSADIRNILFFVPTDEGEQVSIARVLYGQDRETHNLISRLLKKSGIDTGSLVCDHAQNA